MLVRRAKPLLGTIVSIELEARSQRAGSMLVEQAFAKVSAVQRLVSAHDGRSEIGRINDAPIGEPVDVHPWTFKMLKFAGELERQTNGIFSVGGSSVLVKSGLHPALHDGSSDGEAAIELLDDGVVIRRAPAVLDLGALARGFAVDQCCELFREEGISRATINAGGNLRAFGYDEGFPILVRHPEHPDMVTTVAQLRDGAVATTAGYFAGRTHSGQARIPLVNPDGHWNLDEPVSVTVFASDCITAEALTKVVRLSNSGSASLLKQHSARALVFNVAAGKLLADEFGTPAGRAEAALLM